MQKISRNEHLVFENNEMEATFLIHRKLFWEGRTGTYPPSQKMLKFVLMEVLYPVILQTTANSENVPILKNAKKNMTKQEKDSTNYVIMYLQS